MRKPKPTSSIARMWMAKLYCCTSRSALATSGVAPDWAAARAGVNSSRHALLPASESAFIRMSFHDGVEGGSQVKKRDGELSAGGAAIYAKSRTRGRARWRG